MKSLRKFISSNNNRRLFFQLSVAALFGIAILFLWQTAAQRQDNNVRLDLTKQPEDDQPDGPRGNADYGRVPLSFEANQGQTANEVQFLSRGPGYTLFLTPTKAVLSLQHPANEPQKKPVSNILQMELVGANAEAKAEAREELPGKSNYFIGNDPKKWRVDVPTFKKVNYAEVYKGVDLVYYGNRRQLEYDFVVAPNADASQIRWAIPAANKADVDNAGQLVLHINGSDVQMKKPVVYQTINNERIEIAASYSIQNPKSKIQNQEVGFTLGDYDHTAPLVIDPVVVFSSSLLDGNQADSANGIAVDPSGNAYVTGNTSSTNFPTVNAIQTTLNGGQDAFISKYNVAGTALIYSTYLGGSAGFGENGWDIAVDAAGNAFVTGFTTTLDFPVTPATAFQPTKTLNNTVSAGFVTRLSPTGALFYSTYLYGPQGTSAFGIGTDGAGNAYVVGRTGTGFPITASAFSSTNFNSGFLTKLNTNASGSASLVYSTYLGPTGFAEGHAIAVDATGNAYITGNANSTSTNFTSAGAFQTTYGGGGADAFVAKFNTNLSGTASRIYSTYLGGSLNDFGGQATASGSKAIAIDTAGNAYVTGQTASTNFPVANAFQPASGGNTDAFLTKLNPTGSALVYSTYLGGSGSNPDAGVAVAVNVVGNAYVVGLTNSANFPTLFPLSTGGTTGGAFVAKFAPTGNTLVYSTRFGSTGSQGQGVALDGAGNAFTTSAAGSSTTVNEIADPTVIGRVVDEDGIPISGAVVSLTGVPSGPTLSDADGFYTFGLLTSGNNYSIAVSVPNYIFLSQPANNLTKNVRMDFSPVVFGISGQITRCGLAQSGVMMTLTDGKALTATSDGSGNYSYTNLPAGRNYTVTPSQVGFTFIPPSRSLSNLSADQTASFAVTPPPFATIDGRVLTADGRGLRNATVSITDSNGVVQRATTSSFGFFSFDNVASGATYTVRISSRLFRYAPQSLQVDCNQTLPDFVGLE